MTVLITDEHKKDIADMIGIGIHTGLRKWTNSSEAITAWTAIIAMPYPEWEQIVDNVTEEVAKYIESIQ